MSPTPAGLEGQFSQHTKMKQHGVHLLAYDERGYAFVQHRDGKTFAKPFGLANFAGRAELENLPHEPVSFNSRMRKTPLVKAAGHAAAGIGIELARSHVANEDMDLSRKWGEATFCIELFDEELPGLRNHFDTADFVALNNGVPVKTERPDGTAELLYMVLLTKPIPVEVIRTPSGMLRRKLPFAVKEGTSGWFLHWNELAQFARANWAGAVTCWTHQWVQTWAKEMLTLHALEQKLDPKLPDLPDWYRWIVSLGNNPPPVRARDHTFARTLAEGMTTPLAERRARNKARAEAHAREERAAAEARKLLTT